MMLNPAIYQYGYIECIEGLKDHYCEQVSKHTKRIRANKTDKEIERIAGNLRNAKPVKTVKNNIIKVNFEK